MPSDSVQWLSPEQELVENSQRKEQNDPNAHQRSRFPAAVRVVDTRPDCDAENDADHNEADQADKDPETGTKTVCISNP